MCVISLMTPMSSIYRTFTSWTREGGRISAWRRSPMVLNHLLLTFHWEGSLLVRHLWTVFAILGSIAATHEGMHWGDFLNDCTASPGWFLNEDLTFTPSSSSVSVIFVGGEVASGWENLGWLLRADFLNFFLDCLEATEPISLMFIFAEMFTVLKGL